MDQSTEFSTLGYKALVAKFIDANYRFCDFTQKNSDERVVIFRHDIDFSTQAARDLANLEAELGVTSTYFFLIRSPFYNIYEPLALYITKYTLGHRIGLHFDASLYSDNFNCLDCAATENVKFLKKWLGCVPNLLVFIDRQNLCLDWIKKLEVDTTRIINDFSQILVTYLTRLGNGVLVLRISTRRLPLEKLCRC